MNNNQSSHTEKSKEIDLIEVFNLFWAKKILILSVSTIFALASIAYSLSLPNEYKSSTLLIAADSNAGNIASALSRYSGLASMAGFSTSSISERDESLIAIQIMQSQAFMEDFVRENNILIEVLATKGWNFKEDKPSIDTNRYDPETQTWNKGKPTSWEIFESFNQRIKVSKDMKTGFISVSMEYYSPELAQQWLVKYVAAINEKMRQRKLIESSNNIINIQKEIDQTGLQEIREVLFQIISEQIKSKMLAEAATEYALQTVSQPMLPEKKSEPKRSIIVIIFTFLGGFLTVFWILITNRKDFMNEA